MEAARVAGRDLDRGVEAARVAGRDLCRGVAGLTDLGLGVDALPRFILKASSYAKGTLMCLCVGCILPWELLVWPLVIGRGPTRSLGCIPLDFS